MVHELRERLRHLNPDIVFLQEVQGLHLGLKGYSLRLFLAFSSLFLVGLGASTNHRCWFDGRVLRSVLEFDAPFLYRTGRVSFQFLSNFRCHIFVYT